MTTMTPEQLAVLMNELDICNILRGAVIMYMFIRTWEWLKARKERGA